MLCELWNEAWQGWSLRSPEHKKKKGFSAVLQWNALIRADVKIRALSSVANKPSSLAQPRLTHTVFYSFIRSLGKRGGKNHHQSRPVKGPFKGFRQLRPQVFASASRSQVSAKASSTECQAPALNLAICLSNFSSQALMQAQRKEMSSLSLSLSQAVLNFFSFFTLQPSSPIFLSQVHEWRHLKHQGVAVLVPAAALCSHTRVALHIWRLSVHFCRFARVRPSAACGNTGNT